ncbi:helix-turn-helix domain-containing protein [Nonomuraea jabiensis]|uniref:helix-turn-helix domain-containing protein n=1 Tax=Nonomuraea jabiensis TaxID=882448 RepID=UPI0036B56BBE
MLDAAHGYSNARIALRQRVHLDTARLWHGRYADQGIDGLKDRSRTGRPPRFTPIQRAEVKALACRLPVETGVPLSRWSSTDLACEAVGRGITEAMSAATVRRILAADVSRVRAPPASWPKLVAPAGSVTVVMSSGWSACRPATPGWSTRAFPGTSSRGWPTCRRERRPWSAASGRWTTAAPPC